MDTIQTTLTFMFLECFDIAKTKENYLISHSEPGRTAADDLMLCPSEPSLLYAAVRPQNTGLGRAKQRHLHTRALTRTPPSRGLGAIVTLWGSSNQASYDISIVNDLNISISAYTARCYNIMISSCITLCTL